VVGFKLRRLITGLVAALGLVASVLQARADYIGPQLPFNQFGHLANSGPLCAPTATINSFVYLDNLNPKLKLLPGAGTAGDLASSRDMLANGWTFNGQPRAGTGGCGASEQAWWEGKAHWVTDFAQAPVTLGGMVNEPANTIKNWFDGDSLISGFPTWDYLLTELLNKEDVELNLIALDNSFAHAVTLTSLMFDDTNQNGMWDVGETRKVDYLDPNNPTQLFDATLTRGTNGCLDFTWNNGGANTPAGVCVDAAFAESVPEPTSLVLLLPAVLALLWRGRTTRTESVTA
jgi:hypothetical protein